jgi:hypothetical protein
MIRAIIESMMGQWGRSLMYFYDEYSIWINLAVVLYGIWVVVSWVNLKNIRKSILTAIVEQLQNRPKDSTRLPFQKRTIFPGDTLGKQHTAGPLSFYCTPKRLSTPPAFH